MRRGRHYRRIQKYPVNLVQKQEMEISPINRNFPDDDLVVEKISVNSVHEESQQIQQQKRPIKRKKSHLLSNIKKEDLIIMGILFLLFVKRDDDDCEDSDESEDSRENSGESIFSLDKLKKMIPIDKLSENDILMILMVYLLL